MSRKLAPALVLALLLLGHGGRAGDLPPFLVVDLHTHAFNARYVPLAGILRRYRVPPGLAGLVAWILLESTEFDGNIDDPLWKGGDPTPPRAVPALREALMGRPAQDETQGGDYRDDLSKGFRRSAVQEAVKRAFGAVDERPAPATTREAGRRWEELKQQLRFVYLLMRSEQTIAARLLELHPSVGIAAQHYVDLALHYGGRPRHSYRRALIRSRNLTRLLKGRGVRFVPFSPKRGDGLEHVKREVLEHGAMGVKIYPPSGYAPLGNMSAELDLRNLELFEFCLYQDVPLFAHSNDGGFEGRDGYGRRFAVPERWAKVLDLHPDLRFAFGHAGDYDGWYSEPREDGEDWDFLRSRAGAVYQMCLKYPNVYAEFGFHEDILDPEKAEALKRRLEWCFRRSPGFARKICYGSDFPMVARVLGHQEYLKVFWRLFQSSELLRQNSLDFFRHNAVRYMDLEGYLERRGHLLDPVKRRYLGNFARTAPREK